GHEVPEVGQAPVHAGVRTSVTDDLPAALARHPGDPLGVVLRHAANHARTVVQFRVYHALASELVAAGRRAAGECGRCEKPAVAGRTLCESCGEQKKAENRERHNKKGWRLKAEVLAHYGECCRCCGEARVELLQIDHPGCGVAGSSFALGASERG